MSEMDILFRSLTSFHLCSYAKCFLKARPSAFAHPSTLMRPVPLPSHIQGLLMQQEAVHTAPSVKALPLAWMRAPLMRATRWLGNPHLDCPVHAFKAIILWSSFCPYNLGRIDPVPCLYIGRKSLDS